ncbi:MAG: c-type cytochrome [Xanthobacteraceae bacterium]
MVGWILTSRPRVAVILLCVLALLDVARSWNAHVGYAQPVERWQPDPRVYADLAWPPGIDAPAGAPLGARVYAQRCAVCHGPDGRGNGPAAPSLIPRPRDFTLGQYTYKSTPAGQPPTDADLIEVVADGLRASSMPSWRDLLSDEEIRAVVGHIKSLSTVFRALIAYLRVLPPVRKKVPDDRPPAPDDCEVYTFWTTVSAGPGCGP